MLKRERTNVYDFNFHLVFVTKYRKQIFTNDILREEMKTILLSIAKNKEIEVNSIEVMSDYVHMLISFKPKYAPSSMVKSLKGTSAREWFKLHPETKIELYKGHLWSPSFFISTIGNASKKVIKQYIEQQMQKSLKY